MAGIYSPFLQIYQKFIMIYVCIYYCYFQNYSVILEFILLSLRIEALLFCRCLCVVFSRLEAYSFLSYLSSLFLFSRCFRFIKVTVEYSTRYRYLYHLLSVGKSGDDRPFV